MARSEAEKRANRKYYGTRYKQISFKLNKVTNADIIAHLQKIDNMRAYLIRLIEEDMLYKELELDMKAIHEYLESDE